MTLRPVRRCCLLALASMALGLVASPAEARSSLATPSGIALAYDEAVWTRREARPPVAAALSCSGASCSPDVTVLVIDDPRPLPRPGAGARAPGALMTTILALRLTSLSPGGRTRCTTTTQPARFGSLQGYWSRCTFEDRNLAVRELESFAVPQAGGTTLFQLSGPALAAFDSQAFRNLLSDTPGSE